MNEPAARPTWATTIPSFFVDPLARVFLGVLLFVALLLGRSDLAVFCLVMLFLSTGAKLWCKAGSRWVSGRFQSKALRALPGETLHFGVDVRNDSFLPMEIRSRLGGAGALSGEGAKADIRACKVGAHRSARLEWNVKAPGRGVYPIGPPVTEGGDVLGLHFQQADRGSPLELVVYPRLFPVMPLPWQAGELFGALRAKGLIEDPIQLMGTREYQPGRPARAIHWKASVRLNRLQEKVFEPSKRAKLFLSLDVRGFHEAGDAEAFEKTLEAAASLAVRLIRDGVSVGMIANAGFAGHCAPLVPAALRPGHLPILLERMARMTMEPAADLVQVAGHLLDRTTGAGCLHFTHHADGALDGYAAYLRGKRTPASFFVARPAGSGGPPPRHGVAVLPLDILQRHDGGAA